MTQPTTEKLPDAFADDFFSPLGNTKPYFKAAFEGFAGAGKTFTAAKFIIGLHKRIGSKKPVVIFDTETSSKFLKPMFDEAGIQVLVKESRSLADLKVTMDKCRKGLSDILLIDSISHVWENFLSSYLAKKNRSRLEFQDWGVIKPAWKTEFSDPFVRDPFHCVMTGRAGYEYETERNEETGKREMYKSGIKMKVEGETAYEPDMLVLMERLQEMEGGEIKEVTRRANIIKDRSDLLDGKTFDNPSYETFAPAVEFVLKDAIKLATYAEADASALIRTEEEKREYLKNRDIAVEKVEGYLTSVWPGQSATEKKNKIDALEFAYGTRSWTEITGKSPTVIDAGLEKLREFVAKVLEAERAALKAEEEAKAAKEAEKAAKAAGKS